MTAMFPDEEAIEAAAECRYNEQVGGTYVPWAEIGERWGRAWRRMIRDMLKAAAASYASRGLMLVVLDADRGEDRVEALTHAMRDALTWIEGPNGASMPTTAAAILRAALTAPGLPDKETP